MSRNVGPLQAGLAVRLPIGPLLRFANAADALDPNRKTNVARGDRPAEVAYAATAFSADAVS